MLVKVVVEGSFWLSKRSRCGCCRRGWQTRNESSTGIAEGKGAGAKVVAELAHFLVAKLVSLGVFKKKT